MLTAEDRKIRVVDLSLELLAQGIGNAISMRFPDKSIEQMALTYDFKVKPKTDDIFTSEFLPPAADRKL